MVIARKATAVKYRGSRLIPNERIKDMPEISRGRPLTCDFLPCPLFSTVCSSTRPRRGTGNRFLVVTISHGFAFLGGQGWIHYPEFFRVAGSRGSHPVNELPSFGKCFVFVLSMSTTTECGSFRATSYLDFRRTFNRVGRRR